MLATVTVKGQVTVPKEIRTRLKIEPGSQLDFKLNDDGSILVWPLNRSALSIVGLLKRPVAAPVSIEQMNEAAAGGAIERYGRVLAQKPTR